MFTGGTKKVLTPQTEMFITTDEWEVVPSQVIVEENIGEGAFGEVLKGTIKGPLNNPKVPSALKNAICIPVAIKMLKSEEKKLRIILLHKSANVPSIHYVNS